MPTPRTESGSPSDRSGDNALLFQCLSSDELLSDRAWWTIYEDSFPANERERPEVILRSLEQGVGLALALRSGGETIGLATTHLLKNPAAVFLVYLAIARHFRSHGSGGALLEYTWEASAASLSALGLSATGLIWEVESIDQPAGCEELKNRGRRIAFFRRHGGRLLPRPYFQPPVNGPVPVPMSLMYRAAEGDAAPDAVLIDRLVCAIYFEKYGAINGIPSDILHQLSRGEASLLLGNGEAGNTDRHLKV